MKSARMFSALAAAALAAALGAAGCGDEPAPPPEAPPSAPSLDKPPAPAAHEPAAPAPAAPQPDAGGGLLRPAPSEPAIAAPSEPAAPARAAPLAERRKDAIRRAADFLISQQAPDGTWGQGNVGITALCTDALLVAGKTAQDPPVRKALDFLLAQQKEDGGIHDTGLEVYTTSIALMILVKADPAGHARQIEKAKAYLIAHQWDEAESIDLNNPWYGGAGYGKSERPDLSNLGYMLEALHQAGVPKDNPVWAKAVVFVSRCQDRSESNDAVFVGTDSGGMIYSPHAGGESKAGTVTLPDGRKGLKAYASMTYVGFKSFIYADLKRDDPRVEAALEWIRKHWTFEENPELGQQGLYYYYQAAAKALKACGEDVVRDARRVEHKWREELAEAILRRQREDGGWANEADRWFEGYSPVPTSYALIALAECE